ncbi:hypothetical protein BH09DEP1_BH09DEP1_1980 [soil metagenome]
MMHSRNKYFSFQSEEILDNCAGNKKLRSLRASVKTRVEKFEKPNNSNQMKNKFKILLDSVARTSLEANGGSNTFKSNSGFTLIEVLLALAIIGIVLTPIFVVQSIVLRRTSSGAQLFSRIIHAKDLLVDQQFENIQQAQPSSVERKITNPPTALAFSSKKLPENSALKKFKNVTLDSITMQWTEAGNRKRQEKLISFTFRPEEQKQ